MSEHLKRSLPEDASGDFPTEGPCLKWHVSAVTGFAPESNLLRKFFSHLSIEFTNSGGGGR